MCLGDPVLVSESEDIVQASGSSGKHRAWPWLCCLASPRIARGRWCDSPAAFLRSLGSCREGPGPSAGPCPQAWPGCGEAGAAPPRPGHPQQSSGPGAQQHLALPCTTCWLGECHQRVVEASFTEPHSVICQKILLQKTKMQLKRCSTSSARGKCRCGARPSTFSQLTLLFTGVFSSVFPSDRTSCCSLGNHLANGEEIITG